MKTYIIGYETSAAAYAHDILKLARKEWVLVSPAKTQRVPQIKKGDAVYTVTGCDRVKGWFKHCSENKIKILV